ncbi:hypothetical protein DWB68_00125 [Galactobacter valiniphilus]|uniref:Uncharacterized protein n=1 Tax=Galactobacter valiniphilus TaxID=2676122 RepID=A0A399JEN7_9MICC|nr:hypothetical protein DWB68_00125 [Galactobacter valiniphilus]
METAESEELAAALVAAVLGAAETAADELAAGALEAAAGALGEPPQAPSARTATLPSAQAAASRRMAVRDMVPPVVDPAPRSGRCAIA